MHLVSVCFITITYGDNEQLMVNPNCRQLTFMGYLREKCQYDKNAFIDLIEEETGRLAELHMVPREETVRPLLEDRMVFIPVMLEKNQEESLGQYKTVKPLLTDWEKRFPELEKKIKILTGELKRSPLRVLEPRGGRPVDRKASSSNASGRSSSVLGRAPSVSQSGRNSTTSKASAIGRKSLMGNKADASKMLSAKNKIKKR
ncbi:uncharacterized protein CXorf65 homolog [Mya arenaria]|uniref:uncharacterized protein CXorf65 homolog n=1 Tax=Mya arenaria TaxID=6604 RepID=UPI0022E1BA99|nr:uncharacterized protein CXorf65 homolog [Mya arenaria]